MKITRTLVLLLPLLALLSFGRGVYGAPSTSLKPQVVTATEYDLSPALRDLPVAPAQSGLPGVNEIPYHSLPKALEATQAQAGSATLAPTLPGAPAAPALMPEPVFNFDGVNNRFGGWPPDTQGDIGPNHYVQWINTSFAIWQIDRLNHTATQVYGPAPGNTLFQGFGGPCETTNHGDPITLYDSLADRWLMGQFSLPNYPAGPFFQCIAVSQTSDPTGAWYRYAYQMPVDKMNDYPKFGVWPDAYYWTINMFNGSSLTWGGAGVGAFERDVMLVGGPARLIFFDLYAVNGNFGGILPADLDGMLPPPAGAPGLFVEWDDGAWIPSQDALRLWRFQVDWNQPEQSTFGLGGQPDQVLPTADVDPDLCGYSRACLPQPGTANRLDAISDRLMYRLQYRNFGPYQALVSNHTVDVDGSNRAGIHWFELRLPTGDLAWTMYQQGVYSPDAANRWMGSAALDRNGDLAVGYSLASASRYPSVAYAGRLVTDPPGSLTQGEAVLVEGSGSQTLSNRWGDYSMLAVDPLDDCTFWYTQQYVAVTGTNTWATRIGAFQFPGCYAVNQGSLEGAITDAGTSLGLSGVTIRASQGVTLGLQTLSAPDGSYSLNLPEGQYTVSAERFSYQTGVVAPVQVLSGTATTLDFALQPLPQYIISGTVRDAQTGWPLYARLSLTHTPLDPVWSDPVSGFFSLQAPQAISYTLESSAAIPGYQNAAQSIGPVDENLSVNVALQPDLTTCDAPGYTVDISSAYFSDFEANGGGLSAAGVTSWAWGVPSSGPGSAYSGSRVWATNLTSNYSNNETGLLTLPAQDLSVYPGRQPIIRWRQWLKSEAGYDFASLEVSKDDGGTWQTVYGPASGDVSLAWVEQQVILETSYAVPNLLARFKFTSDSSLVFPGWYLDDLQVGAGVCQPPSGGLVVGNVFDANTGLALNGASLVADSGGSAESAAPLDPAAQGGFYLLYAPAGGRVLTATHPGGYLPQSASLVVPGGAAVRQDFSLPAGRLGVAPTVLSVALEPGQATTRTLVLSNTGGAPANYEWIELHTQPQPFGPLQPPEYSVKPFREAFASTENLGLPDPPAAPVLTAGQVLRTWTPTGVSGPWGIAYDDLSDAVWISSPTLSWGGDDRLHEFHPDGIPTGRSFQHASPHTVGPADLAFNWNTGRLWSINVNTGQANCIYEIDPATGYTGRSICPGEETGFHLSQRGLAYDPDSDTWFAGGWNDLMIYRFDAQGNLISSVNTGLAVAGLAYNPTTQHLFAMLNGTIAQVYVLDVANNYQVLGQFTPEQPFGAQGGAGLELDCDGNLWAVDQTGDRVYQLASGEGSTVCQRDVPWLSATPISGTLTAPGSQAVQVDFDAATLDQPGIYPAALMARNSTPNDLPAVPITLTITPPPGWGKLSGEVRSLGYCDLAPAALPGAEVQIESSGGLTWRLQSNSTGYYQRWFDQSLSPLTVTVSAPKHTTGLVSGVQVSAGLTTTMDFDLYWQQPCIQSDTQAISLTLVTGENTVLPLTLTNEGHRESSFEWIESIHSAPGVVEVDLPWLAIQPVTGTLPALTGSQAFSVTLDASAIPAGQTYTAWLVAATADPIQPELGVPVTLTVRAPGYGVSMAPDMALQGVRTQVVTYTLSIANTGDGFVDSYSLYLSQGVWPAVLSSPLAGPLAQGESSLFQVAVHIPPNAAPGAQDILQVTAISNGDPTKQAVTTLMTQVIPAVADLHVTMHAAPDPAQALLPLAYTLAISNTGPTAAPWTALVDILPASAVPASLPSGCTLTGSILTCELGLLPAGARLEFALAVRPMAPGMLANRAILSSEADDPQPDDNQATLWTQVVGYMLRFPLLYRP